MARGTSYGGATNRASRWLLRSRGTSRPGVGSSRVTAPSSGDRLSRLSLPQPMESRPVPPLAVFCRVSGNPSLISRLSLRVSSLVCNSLSPNPTYNPENHLSMPVCTHLDPSYNPEKPPWPKPVSSQPVYRPPIPHPSVPRLPPWFSRNTPPALSSSNHPSPSSSVVSSPVPPPAVLRPSVCPNQCSPCSASDS